MSDELKRKLLIYLTGIIGMVSLVVGVSFAAFSSNITGTKENVVNTGCLKVELSDNGSITLDNAYPVTDEEGLANEAYVYTISNTCSVNAYYETTINALTGTTTANLGKVKLSLSGDSYVKPTKENALEETTLLNSDSSVVKTYRLDEGYIRAGEAKTFNLRMWVDYDVTSLSGTISNKLIIQSEARTNNTLVYNTKTVGYFSGSREQVLKDVDYSNISSTSGIVESKNNSETSYYFRGTPTNTVVFGTYNSALNGHSSGDSIRWKILSTNNDGSVNLITEEYIGTSSYTNVNTLLTSFYNTHLSDEESYIKTSSTFCKEGATNGQYLAKIRTEKNNPSSKCNGTNVFTKIGLPTVDEVMFAGGTLNKANTSYYLYNGNGFMMGSMASASTIYASSTTKSIYEASTSTSLGVRPVITLKADTMLSGLGTSASPYYVAGTYTNPSTTTEDTTKPVIVYARVDEDWSNQNKQIEISAKDNTSISGYIVKTTNSVPAANDSSWEASTSKKYKTVNTYDNGTYYVFAKDINGNISNAEQVKVERVDKVAPTCSIRLNSTPDSTLYKTLTIESTETNIDLKGYSWQDDEDIKTSTRKIGQNGVYTAYLKDLAGNQGSCSITVTSVTEFYTVIYNPNGGTGQNKTDYAPVGGDYTLLKNEYTREGYGFIGWDTNSSSTTATYEDKEEVSSLATSGNTITLYAIWDGNALNFDDQTVQSTFDTTNKTITNGIDAATNGTGSYTYAITGGNTNNYFSLSGRNIIVKANTPANSTGYQIEITATDSNSHRTKAATYTIVVNKKAGTLSVSPTSGTLTFGTNATAAITKGGDGTLGCSSSDNSVATCSISGTTLTIVPKANTTDGKTATITITLGAGNNYTAASNATYSVTVNRKTLTCPSTPVDKTYNGNSQASGVSCPDGSTAGGDTNKTNASDSYAQTCTANSGYKFASTCSVNWKIKPKAATITAKAQSVVYGTTISKTTNDVTVDGLVSGHSLNSISLAGSTTNVTTTGKITPSAAVIKDGSNNTVTTNYNITYEQGNLTITQREVTVTAPTMNSATLTYNNDNQTITGNAGSCTAGGTMYYYTTNYTTSTSPAFATSGAGWSTTFPSSASERNAGTYHLWYYCYVSDTTNNKAKSGSSINTALEVTKEIQKYTPTLTISKTSASVDYNSTGSFTATPTAPVCKAPLTATSANGTYVKVSTSNSGTYDTTATHSSTGSGTAYTFYYKGMQANSNATNITVSYVPTDTENCNSAQTKTIGITVNKITCPAPTNVQVATDKKVTWTNASGATSYQISMSPSSGFAAHTNGNAYNSITDSAGNRTVYVRSVCNTTNYSSQYSENASKAVTVHSVTLTKGSGISTVTGAGNYIAGSNVSIDATVSDGWTWSKWTNTSGGSQVTATKAYTISSINENKAYTANATGNTYTATFYYNNKQAPILSASKEKAPNPSFLGGNKDAKMTSLAEGTVANTGNTYTCTVTSGSTCTVTIPDVVKNSTGYYSNAYAGLKTSTGNSMTASVTKTSTSVTLSANTNYYTLYSTQIIIYKPVSETTCNSTNTVFYKNQWINNSTTISDTVLSTSATGTTNNATHTSEVSGYHVSDYKPEPMTYGYYGTNASLSDLIDHRDTYTTSYYAVLSKEESHTATFYYSNSNTGGKISQIHSASRAYYITCEEEGGAAAFYRDESYNLPSTTAPYGTTLLGWATSANTMTTVSDVDFSNTSYYAVYQKSEVRINYYGTSSYTTRTDIYRNGVYGSNTNYTMYLSSSATGTSNYTTATGPGSSVWTGLSTASDTTPEYTSVGDYNTGAAYSSTNTFYTVYQFNVQYEKGSNVTSIGTTTGAGVGYCRVNSTSQSAGGTSCSVTLPSITPNNGYTSVGWNTTSGATTGTAEGASYTVNANPKTLYANAKASTYTITYKDCGDTTFSGTHGNNYPQSYTYGTGATLDSPTKQGWTFGGYYTSSSCSGTAVTSIGTSETGNKTLYAKWTGNTYTATFYYNNGHAVAQSNKEKSNNPSFLGGNKVCEGSSCNNQKAITLAEGTVSNTGNTYQCTVTSGSSCTITIPDVIKNSTGYYYNEYAGLRTTTGNSMTASVAKAATTVTLSGDTSYYATYSSQVTLYRPTSTSVCGSTNSIYRNQWINNSTTISNTVLSTSATGTTDNYTYTSGVSGYDVNVYAVSNNTQYGEYNNIKNTIETTFYAVLSKEVEATFYYSSSAAGAKSSTTKSGYQYVICKTNSTAGIENGDIYTGEISQTAPTGTTAVGWSTSANNIPSTLITQPTTANTTYYRVYRQALTIYYPTGTNSGNITNKNNVVYRNAYLATASDSSFTTVVANGSTSTTQLTNAGVTSSVLTSMYGTFTGLATSANTTTKYDINNSTNVVNNSTTTYYVVNTFTTDVEVTFYYSNNAANGTKTSTTKTGTETGTIYCSSTSTITWNKSPVDITPTLTGEAAPTGTTAVGWSTSVNSIAASPVQQPTTNKTTYYRVYRQALTIYYPTGTSSSDITSVNDKIYRTAFLVRASDTTFTTKVVNGVAGYSQLQNTDITSSVLTSMYGTFTGLATSANITTKYNINNSNSVINSSRTTYYVVNTYTTDVEATFYYSNSSIGAKTNSKASGTQTRYIYCSSTSAVTTSLNSNGAISAPSTTAPYGTSLLGWATSASTMTTVSSVTTENNSYYAVYQKSGVRINYYGSSSYTTRNNIYRNGVYGSNTNYTMYLATSATGLSNYATATGPGSSVWAGLSTSSTLGSGTLYTSVGDYNTGAAYSSTNTFYTVYQFNMNYQKGANVASLGTTTGSGVGYCRVQSTSQSNGGTSCSVTLPSFTPNDGYTSVGWNTTNGATTGTAEGASYTVNANPKTLYANAKASTYTITYKDCGDTTFSGSHISGYPTQYTYGTGATLDSPTKTNYTFAGYYSTSACSGTAITSIGTTETGNKTFYAKWTGNTYTVTLNKGTGTSAGTTSITATYDSSTISPSTITLASKSYTISGFTTATSRNSDGATVSSTSTLTSTATLNGYYTASSGGNKILNAATTAAYPSTTVSGYLSSGKWVGTENKTLYAQFGSMSSKTLPTITKSGYTCGWTTSSTGTTIEYESGGSITPSANTTLYGVCLLDGVPINIKNNGSYITGTSFTVTLYDGTTATSYTKSINGQGTIEISGIPDGTYNVYAGKDANHPTNVVDTGIDVSIVGNRLAAGENSVTIEYYSLTITTSNTSVTVNGTSVANNGTVTVLGGTTTVANNYAHSIVATPSTNYTFSSWSKTSGTATITSTSTASTTVKVGAASTIKASSTRNLYTVTTSVTNGITSQMTQEVTAGENVAISIVPDSNVDFSVTPTTSCNDGDQDCDIYYIHWETTNNVSTFTIKKNGNSASGITISGNTESCTTNSSGIASNCAVFTDGDGTYEVNDSNDFTILGINVTNGNNQNGDMYSLVVNDVADDVDCSVELEILHFVTVTLNPNASDASILRVPAINAGWTITNVTTTLGGQNTAVQPLWYSKMWCCSSNAPTYFPYPGTYDNVTSYSVNEDINKYCEPSEQNVSDYNNLYGQSCNIIGATSIPYIEKYTGVQGAFPITQYRTTTSTGDTVVKTLQGRSAYGSIPNPTRTGYAFDGWYTAASGGTKITDSSTVTNFSNHTLYAHWKPKVSVNVINGTVSPSTQTVDYNTSPSFEIAPNAGVNGAVFPTFSCTGSQTADMYWITWDNGGSTTEAPWYTDFLITKNNDPVDGITIIGESGSTCTTSEGQVDSCYSNSADGRYTIMDGTKEIYSVAVRDNPQDVKYVLSINSVSAGTTCNVSFDLLQYTVSYAKGSDSTATDLPSSQTKSYGQTITLSDTVPTSTNNAFIGWSTTTSATTSSTWYDEGSSYSANANLALKAQWYDVNSLEESYTTFVQAGSGSYGTGGDFNFTSSTTSVSVDGGGYKAISLTAPTVTNHTPKFLTYWGGHSGLRYFRIVTSGISARMAGSSAVSDWSMTYRYLQIRNRTATTYTGTIDSRIDRLQKIQDKAIKYSEIKVKATTNDNITVSSTIQNTSVSPDSGYYYLGSTGYNISNASTSGANSSRTAVRGILSSYSTNGASNLTYALGKVDDSTTPKVKITIYGLEVLQKTARTTTFAPTTSKGLTRYNALVELENDKTNYFPASYVKLSSQITGSDVTTTAWGSGSVSKTLSIPDGRILGIAAYGVKNGTGGSNATFANITRAYAAGTNTKSGTFHMTFWGGNRYYTSTDGTAMTNVCGYGYALYISSGTMTIS